MDDDLTSVIMLIPIDKHSQFDPEIILLFTFLIVWAISLTTRNGNRKDNERMIVVFLQLADM